ncbi:MAG: glycosyltransferase family 4 protein [Syntrophorhabdales bacterium]|jgi:glycosyltransferase involved in cell wall biosynthesis
MKMRIAYIAVKGVPIGGGIEKLTEEIGSRLVAKGHEVVVYSSRDYGTTDGFHRGMEVRTVPSINTKSLHKLSICFHATRHALKDGGFDVFHVHAVGPSIFAIFPRLKGIPTVVQIHALEWARDKWGPVGKTFFKLADYSAVYFPHKTTSVSKVQKEYFERKFGREIVHIPTGVNRVEKRKANWLLTQGIEADNYMLFAGRLVAEKGVHLLIKAFRNIDTDMKLVLAGDAAHAEKYKTLLRDLAAGDRRILFPGFVSGPPLEELFSNARLFCLPSTLEGLPIALLEAMSYGNCCVASDIRENRETLEGHGYTFRNRDAHDLRNVLDDLMRNPDKVEAKKQAARDHVLRHYSWDLIADRMEELYRSLLEEQRGR